MTTQALRRAVRTPLAVYRAGPTAFTFALLGGIDVMPTGGAVCGDEDIQDRSGQ
jgi:hypothetical protein